MFQRNNAKTNNYKGVKIVKLIPDIQYANVSQSQKLDLYLPDNIGNKNFPLLFFIHGGGFSKGDKAKGKINALLHFGSEDFVIASINYRLSGEAGFPAGIDDCETALDFLIRHFAKYNIDPTKIAIVGNSSGGNYALMLATRLSKQPIKQKLCVVALYPVTNLLTLSELANAENNDEDMKKYVIKNSEQYFKKEFAKITENDFKKASPIFNITKDFPTTLLQHGDLDEQSPISQSQEFYEKALTMGIKIELDIKSGAKHNDEIFETNDNLERVFCFIKNSLK